MSIGSSPPATTRKAALYFWCAAVAGVALRLLALHWPPNFDFESWNIVADATLEGRNVYAATHRYNYGPAWAGILAALKWIGGAHFRLAICILLSAVDLGIAIFLRKRVGTAAAIAFFLAPWSILISGHHGQFDNVAVLLGLLAVGYTTAQPLYAREGLAGLTLKQTCVAAALLGLSLVVKHLLFLFPVWIAFRVPDLKRRLLWIAVPVGIFAVSFLPFWAEGREGILTNVIGYESDEGAPFLNTFGPGIIDMLLGCQPHHRIERLFFYGALLAAGALLRRRSLLELLAFYSAFLVIFSSGIWNHYLAIAVLFTALFRNGWSIAFQLLAVPYYILEHDAFNYGRVLAASSAGWNSAWLALESWGHHVFVALLVAAVVYVLWRRPVGEGWNLLIRKLGEALRGRA